MSQCNIANCNEIRTCSVFLVLIFQSRIYYSSKSFSFFQILKLNTNRHLYKHYKENISIFLHLKSMEALLFISSFVFYLFSDFVWGPNSPRRSCLVSATFARNPTRQDVIPRTYFHRKRSGVKTEKPPLHKSRIRPLSANTTIKVFPAEFTTS